MSCAGAIGSVEGTGSGLTRDAAEINAIIDYQREGNSRCTGDCSDNKSCKYVSEQRKLVDTQEQGNRWKIRISGYGYCSCD